MAFISALLQEKRESWDCFTRQEQGALYYATTNRQLTFSSFVFCTISVAGRDTTANCLSWAFYELHQNPHTLEKLRQEIDTTLQGQPATYDDVADRLPFLHAVVQETLRLHPSVPKVRDGHEQDLGCLNHEGTSFLRSLVR
jgi:cytochrome P450